MYLSKRKNRRKQIINLLLLNNFYPVISRRRVEKESDELLYAVWSLVMVIGCCQRKRLKGEEMRFHEKLKPGQYATRYYNII